VNHFALIYNKPENVNVNVNVNFNLGTCIRRPDRCWGALAGLCVRVILSRDAPARGCLGSAAR
jgi:hypothetical protein